MGILDDAIREHLELRRQHGADPDELRQVERSVLGGGDAAEVPQEQPAAAEPQPPEAEEHVEPVPAPPAPPAPSAPPEAAEPEPAEPEHVDQPTRQFTAAEVAAAERPARAEPAGEPEPEPGEHDELEDTPEFLQETPEHDRLWFEQKPPKDFDF